MSNIETLKDDGIMEAISNHRKLIPTEVTPTPNSEYITQIGAKQEMAETEHSDLKIADRSHGNGQNMCQFYDM